jgi:hypothetical protein
VRFSERLAEEYRGMIGRHPREGEASSQSMSADADADDNDNADAETCTTWSRFLPKQTPLTAAPWKDG